MMSRNEPTNAAPEAASPAENRPPACCEPTWLRSRSSSGSLHHAVIRGDGDRLQAEVHVEWDRLTQAGGDRRVVHCRHARQPSWAGSLLMVAIGAPALIGSPSAIGSSAIVPALCAVISFSIFIASMMHRIWPSATVSPCLTSTFHMFPCSGDSSMSGPPALEDLPGLAERLGACAPARSR